MRVRACVAASAAFLLFVSLGCKKQSGSGASQNEYVRLMNSGKNYLDQGEAQKALENFQQAVKLTPTDPDAHLNLANAHLRAGNSQQAIAAADEVLKLDQNSAAAHFVKGSAYIRLKNFEEAVKSLQIANRLDPSEPAGAFQLGYAHLQLKQFEEAITPLSDAVRDQPEHPSAHFHLSQALRLAGREQEAEQSLALHQQIAEKNAGQTITPDKLERSKFTQARVPFVLEQPKENGIAVKFVDATQQAFGADAGKYSGPIAVLDPNHTGTNSLFVLEPGQGFRLLWNSNAVFQPDAEPYPHNPEAKYTKMLVGDMQNDRFEDVVVLSDRGAHIFKFATNGMAMDVAPFSRLQGLAATDGALADLDFTGKLDLLAVTANTNDVRLYRQFGPLLFTDITRTSGIPANLTSALRLAIDDWPKDEMMDVIVTRTGAAPLLLAKERGGLLVATNVANWPGAQIVTTGDLNNDLRTDFISFSGGKLRVTFHGTGEQKEFGSPDANVRALAVQDYDNDGWLDVWAIGDQITIFRNYGQLGLKAVDLGLAGLQGKFASIEFADFDVDGDSDAIITIEGGGLKYLRNDGGNANKQLKLRLLGNRSNASALGVKVEVTSGGLRLIRTVQKLPVEIGVGSNTNLESVVVHWFNLAASNVDIPVEPTQQLAIFELILPEGSCPYMYAWDGKKFRFVTDLLGAAPIGLPVADGVIIQSDPDEYAWIGNETNFVAKDGYYTVQITEELREALYLDDAKLVVVDHPPQTEVHPTDKLMPRKPFPPSTLAAVQNEHPLLKAESLSGRDVTDLLKLEDTRRVSPEKLRDPQKRGLAETHGVILDFGPLQTDRPLVLVLNGWLRFGGGMANINASHDPNLPFPFPRLEAEVNGAWKPVEVTVGAPAGKTKTIMADLTGRLPSGARRLRLTTAFEIHWDRIALFERANDSELKIVHLAPDHTDLHWRGFSVFEDLSWDWPLTPDYNRVEPNPKWRITPGGWCTRYGDVSELIARRDEGMVVMNGGDELTLRWAVSSLPPKTPGHARQFFIYTDGWDKDSDFHVRAGTTIEPLPWHGMDDQLYPNQPRPKFPSDELHRKYNTRWVPPQTLDLAKRQSN
ncbi:MAG TPA: tetratricopeptide repeat protein [Verrucomicrobiae bacterium]